MIWVMDSIPWVRCASGNVYSARGYFQTKVYLNFFSTHLGTEWSIVTLIIFMTDFAVLSYYHMELLVMAVFLSGLAEWPKKTTGEHLREGEGYLRGPHFLWHVFIEAQGNW